MLPEESLESRLRETDKYLPHNPAFAKGLLKSIIREFPDQVGAYIRMGDIYFGIDENMKVAERYYKRAFEIKPIRVLYSKLGLVNHKKGNLKKAEEFYRIAVNKKPKPVEMLELAIFYLDIKRYNESIILLRNTKNDLLRKLKKKEKDIALRKYYTHTSSILIEAYWEKGLIKESQKEQEELDNSPYRLRMNIKKR